MTYNTDTMEKIIRVTSVAWRDAVTRLNEHRDFRFNEDFRDDALHLWVVICENSLVGFACLREYAHNSGLLALCGILPSARGRGLQGRLIAVREGFLRHLGIRTALAYAKNTNYASINSFVRNGYSICPPWDHASTPGHIYFSKRW